MEEAFDNPASPFIDVEAVTDEEEEGEEEIKASKTGGGSGGEQAKEEQKMLSLAEQFLAAMPDRIKYEQSPGMEEEEEDTIFPDCCSQGPDCWSQSEDLGVESMADDQSVDFEFNFEEATTACQGYRDTSTPTSSLSPASFSLESPLSSYQASPSPSCLGFSFDHRSPPTTAEIREFLQAEKDLSNLTLSEREQRELFLAAQIIQKAYRSYKGRKKSSEMERQGEDCKEDKVEGGQAKEAKAAVVIQNYYRRYKQVKSTILPHPLFLAAPNY